MSNCWNFTLGDNATATAIHGNHLIDSSILTKESPAKRKRAEDDNSENIKNDNTGATTDELHRRHQKLLNDVAAIENGIKKRTKIQERIPFVENYRRMDQSIKWAFKEGVRFEDKLVKLLTAQGQKLPSTSAPANFLVHMDEDKIFLRDGFGELDCRRISDEVCPPLLDLPAPLNKLINQFNNDNEGYLYAFNDQGSKASSGTNDVPSSSSDWQPYDPSSPRFSSLEPESDCTSGLSDDNVDILSKHIGVLPGPYEPVSQSGPIAMDVQSFNTSVSSEPCEPMFSSAPGSETPLQLGPEENSVLMEQLEEINGRQKEIAWNNEILTRLRTKLESDLEGTKRCQTLYEQEWDDLEDMKQYWQSKLGDHTEFAQEGSQASQASRRSLKINKADTIPSTQPTT
ncbi:MAG: hypothetical protein Q9209_001405 [Squamulea sp. 1 TL-2023]